MDEGQVRLQAATPMIETALALLAALRPADLVAVVRLPRMVQGTDFTVDREAVRAGLSQTTGRAAAFASAAGGLTLGAASGVPSRHGTAAAGADRPSVRGLARRPVPLEAATASRTSGSSRSALVDDLTLRARDSVYGLERVMDRLAPLPGAKHVVLFSEAMFLGANAGMLARAETAAARARATVTVVQPEEVARDSVATGPSVAADPTATVLAAGLEQISGATGGSVVKVGKSGGIDCVVGAMTGRYALAFESTPPERDGRPRPVAVQASRPGLTVRARRVFAAGPASAKTSGDERVRTLLASAISDSTVPLRASMLTAPVAGGRVRTFVQSILGVAREGAEEVTAAAAVLDSTGRVVSSFALEPAALNEGDPRRGLVLGGARDLDPASTGCASRPCSATAALAASRPRSSRSRDRRARCRTRT